jgi:hypothetical protein
MDNNLTGIMSMKKADTSAGADADADADDGNCAGTPQRNYRTLLCLCFSPIDQPLMAGASTEEW